MSSPNPRGTRARMIIRAERVPEAISGNTLLGTLAVYTLAVARPVPSADFSSRV